MPVVLAYAYTNADWIPSVVIEEEKGGYDTIFEAAKAMGRVEERTYRPNPENAAAYDRLYREYKILHDHFGRGGNDVMKRLKKIKAEARR